MKKKTIWKTAVIILSVLLVTGCDLITQTPEPTPMPTPVSESNVIAEANLIPVDHITLRFAMAGRVADILVEEGDQADQGQALARLENVEALEAQILSAERAVIEAEQRLDDLRENADLSRSNAQQELAEAKQNLVEAERAWDEIDTDEFKEELDDARLDMIDAEEDLEDAEDTLADYQDLDEDNLVRQRAEDDVEEAQQDYDEARWAYEELKNQQDLAEARLETAQAAVEDAERRVEATRDGPNPDDLALANASLEQAQGQLRAAERALGDVELTAPFAGEIVQIELTEGAYTSPEQMAFVLADMSEWVLETNDLTEEEVVDIEVGDEVTITFDALPELEFTGEVESISDYSLERFGDITYVVRIQLADLDSRLRWGMTAEVEFQN